jgi:hypothetical protein
MKNRIRTIYEQLKKDNTYLSLINPYLEIEISKFELNNSQSISNYDKWIMNSQKENYLLHPIYTLHEVKNRESANTIVAKVKWIYDIKGVIGKSKVISVFIASTSKFPKGLKDKELLKNAPIIIKEYFNKVSPPFEIDQNDIEQNKAEVELYYYIKNKQPEIKARLEPNFYLSKNKNQNNFERIIANVKWGFPSPNSDKPKRYITLYLGNNKLHYKDLKADKTKSDFASTVSDLLNKQIPFEFNPPNIE